MNRRNLIAAAVALFTVPAKADDGECARLRDALERIAQLDEADGGKHPSQILVERYARGVYK